MLEKNLLAALARVSDFPKIYCQPTKSLAKIRAIFSLSKTVWKKFCSLRSLGFQATESCTTSLPSLKVLQRRPISCPPQYWKLTSVTEEVFLTCFSDITLIAWGKHIGPPGTKIWSPSENFLIHTMITGLYFIEIFLLREEKNTVCSRIVEPITYFIKQA